MGRARTAIQTGNWAQALAAFTRAAAIENTREAAAGIAAARRKLADMQAETAVYDAALAEAKTAAAAGDWQKALDAYTRAAAIDSTPQAQTGIANAKKKLADAAAAGTASAGAKREYARFMAEGGAAAGAGEWQKALDAYTRAAAIDSTPQAQAGIANAKKKLADAAADRDKAKPYDRAMADAKAAADADDWKKALDAYAKAYELKKTDEAKAGIAQAKKKLGR